MEKGVLRILMKIMESRVLGGLNFSLEQINGYVANALTKIIHPYRLKVFCEDFDINYAQEQFMII